MISGSSYDFDDPWAITSDGSHVWVTNYVATRSPSSRPRPAPWSGSISGSSYGFDGPRASPRTAPRLGGEPRWQLGHRALGLDRRPGQGHWRLELRVQRPRRHHLGRHHVWVANYSGNSVTELSASTGALVKVIGGSSYGFDDPVAIASDGTHVWVANQGWQLGHRALGLDRRPGQGDQRLELRVQRSRGHRLGRHPRLGGERGWQLGHRALGLDRRPGQGRSRFELRVQRARGASPRAAPTSGWRTTTATRSPSSRPRPAPWSRSSAARATGSTAPSPSPRTAPTSGWRTRWQLGHRALGLDRRPGQGHQRLELRVQRPRRPSPRTAPTSGWRTSGNSVTELSPRPAPWSRCITGSSYRFNDPGAIASDGTHVWVAN